MIAEPGPKPGGNGQATLVVEGVLEPSRKFRESAHESATKPHFEPFCSTILHLSAFCKAKRGTAHPFDEGVSVGPTFKVGCRFGGFRVK